MRRLRRLKRVSWAEPSLNSEVDFAVSQGGIAITFFVPCYNEEENVEKALEAIQRVMASRGLTYEVLVMDDGSADKTSEAVRRYQAAHPDAPIRLHRNPTNLGLGTCYLEGASLAKGEYYMIVNGDGDLSADSLSAIVDRMGQADIISPYLANQKDRPLLRRVLSAIFKKLVDFLGGCPLRYYNGPVLHRRSNIVGAGIRARGFGYQAELLCDLIRRGCSVIEVPYTSVYPHQQTDAFRLKNILSVGESLVRIFWTRMNQ